MRFYICVLLYFNSSIMSAQIEYEKGYYISNDGKRVECLIKNIDWKNNPTTFEYKLVESAESHPLSIHEVAEFGVIGYSKYVRKKALIDRSLNSTNKLTYDKSLSFNEETLFLKALIEGEANLYYFEDGEVKKYFYNTGIKKIKQLIFKRYFKGYNRIQSNNTFRQQLINDFECSSISKNDIERLNYKKSDLVTLFSNYNSCKNTKIAKFVSDDKDNLVKISIRPGLRFSNAQLTNLINQVPLLTVTNKLSFRIGAELEFILPYRKGTWSIIAEPTYQIFSSTNEETNISQPAINYTSIEFPSGLRHYLFLNDNSKLFVNGVVLFDIPINSSINVPEELSIRSTINFGIGLGYRYKNKISIEARYHSKRELLNGFQMWEGKHNDLSVILGYSL